MDGYTVTIGFISPNNGTFFAFEANITQFLCRAVLLNRIFTFMLAQEISLNMYLLC